MVRAQNWAELKFGKRLKRLAKEARSRVRARHPEKAEEHRRQEQKEWIWHTLTDSSYSRLAFTTGIFLAVCIALSVFAFILETVPSYEQAPGYGNYFFYAECFFVVIFTIELSLKFWSTPQTTLQFFSDPLNVIDILSILPFFIELSLVLVFDGEKIAMWDLRGLRAFRLMRMLKMGRFSGDLQLLAKGMLRARMSIAMLCGTLMLGMVIFSVIMWLLEQGTWNPGKQCYSRTGEVFFNGCSPFESVPFGFWWSLTTMTTVGYGDTFPLTPLGRVVGGIAMLAGIFCVALPTGILCAEFSKLYEEKRKDFQMPNADTESMAMRSRAELELIVDGERLAETRKDLEDQLMYLKRLAYIYCDAYKKSHSREEYKHLKFKKQLKTIDPLYDTFLTQAVESLDTIRSIVTSVASELGHLRAYTKSLTRRQSTRNLETGRSSGSL
jgi:hypothetical protein